MRPVGACTKRQTKRWWERTWRWIYEVKVKDVQIGEVKKLEVKHSACEGWTLNFRNCGRQKLMFVCCKWIEAVALAWTSPSSPSCSLSSLHPMRLIHMNTKGKITDSNKTKMLFRILQKENDQRERSGRSTEQSSSQGTTNFVHQAKPRWR